MAFTPVLWPPSNRSFAMLQPVATDARGKEEWKQNRSKTGLDKIDNRVIASFNRRRLRPSSTGDGFGQSNLSIKEKTSAGNAMEDVASNLSRIMKPSVRTRRF